MASTYSSSTPFAFSSPNDPVATSHKQQPTTHGNTIKPVTAIGGAAATQTGVSAMPQVNSGLNFTQPQAFSAPKVNAGNPNPLDAQYFTDVGKLDAYFQSTTADINAAIAQAQANANITFAGINQSRTEANQSEANVERDISNALGVLAHNQPIDIKNQNNASNKAGLAASGYNQDALSNINFQYDTKRTGLNNQEADAKQQLANALSRLDLQQSSTQQNLAAALAGYQRQLGDLNTNYGLDKQQALLNTIGRATAADQSAAQNMQFGSAPAFKTIPYTSPSGVRGVLHIYPDGRRVFVKGGMTNQI